MCDYMSEAEALNDIYDGCEDYYYSEFDREEWIEERQNDFPKDSRGKFVVCMKPKRKADYSRLYLVDRKITRRFWRSPNARYAMCFNSETVAKTQAARYHKGKIYVKKI